MKVDYTIPALQPEAPSAVDLPPERGVSFHAQLAGASVQLPIVCEQELRLDVRPFTATYLAPPPPPKNLVLIEPQAQRRSWRNMLWRHGQALCSGASLTGTRDQQPIRVMLDMLAQMQQMEDSIISHSVAVRRG
jgi:hypothetical protein